MVHKGPVTAVAFFSDVLLVGEGPLLKVYRWKTGDLQQCTQIFSKNKIHGIRVDYSRDAVLFWGGKSFSVLKMDEIPAYDIHVESKEKKLFDWIISAEFSVENDHGIFAYIQTAHNTILSLDKDLKLLEKSFCEERSILYSGTILPLENGDALVAAGTVLGGVIVWKLSDKTIMYNFTLHEGSIFGVRFSPDGKRLVSCSDDRSIRLWSLDSGEQLAIGWGHLARIWELHFIGTDQIVSLSEDCTARLWDYTNDDNKLECRQIFEGHLGRNTWAGDIYPEHGLLATGGSDGRVRLWDLERMGEFDNTRQVWSLSDVTDEIMKNEIFKDYVYLGDKLVVATSAARAFCLEDKATTGLQWKELKGLDLDVYSYVRGWKSHNTACIGKRDGTINLIDFGSNPETLEKVKLDLCGKLADVIPFAVNDKSFFLALTQNPNDPFVVYGVQDQAKFTLKAPYTFQATSVVYIPSLGVLVLGSRHGAIALYKVDLLNRRNYNGDHTMEASCVVRKLMSEDTITSVILLESHGILNFTSRMGHCSTARIGVSPMSFEQLSLNKTPRGTIEGSKLVNGSILLYGFKNDLFFVWNESSQYEVMNERCGGAHRNWYIDISDHDENDYELVYTKVSKIAMANGRNSKKFEKTLLDGGTHGREIRTVSLSPLDLGPYRLFATASEDTCVRFGIIDSVGKIEYHCTQRKHVSGIQSGKWTPDGKFFLSSAAREELVVWKVHISQKEVVDGDGAIVSSLPYATLPISTDIPDLRIMDFGLTSTDDDKYLLVTVYSDSTIKIWLMDLRQKEQEAPNEVFTLLSNGTYRTCCLINSSIILSESSTFLTVSATDGHLAIWCLDSILNNSGTSSFPEPLERLQIHQSSVKCSVYFAQSSIDHSPSSFLHVSGGDDNSLVMTSLVFKNGTVTAKKVTSIEDAHSSTIAGISKISDSKFVTTSVDQNIKIWKIEEANNTIRLLTSKYTTIADTGPIDSTCMLEDPVILFGGSGLSAWSIKGSGVYSP